MAVDSRNIPTDDVRQGETGHHVRYILGWSLFLGVLALGAITLLMIGGANPAA